MAVYEMQDPTTKYLKPPTVNHCFRGSFEAQASPSRSRRLSRDRWKQPRMH